MSRDIAGSDGMTPNQRAEERDHEAREPFGRGDLGMDPSGCDRIATVFIERPTNWHDEVLCEEHGQAARAALAAETRKP